MSTLFLLLIVAAAVGAGVWVFRQSGADSSPKRLEPGPAAKKENWLVGTGGEVDGKTFLVGQRMLTIGRTPNNAIQITDPAASRQHCQIKPVDGGLQVVDMSSTNATFINGEAMKMGRLSEGDELRIGEARFVFRRRVEAEVDDRLGAKVAGPAVNKSTEEAGQSPELIALVKKTVAENGGDLEQAASRLGVAPDIVRRILDDRKQL